MHKRALLLLPFLAACSAKAPSTTLTPEHAAAMQDSVRGFMNAFAKDVSSPPVGTKAREALARFYSPEIVMSTDLAPDTPMFVQTLDSLVPADEVVTAPPGIKGTSFEWHRTVITPLAPGLATFTASYTEHVTDSSGTVTDLHGVQLALVRNGPSGWRYASLQSAHPLSSQQRQMDLMARLAPKP
jgi:hypothetical protein